MQTPNVPGEVEVLLEEGRDAVCWQPGTLRFRVLDAETGRPITGLQPHLRYHIGAVDRTMERRNFTEESDGVYAFPFRPSIPRGYALLFGAESGGREIAEVFALDVATARATATVDGVTYRVGAEWVPSHVHSHPTAEVRLLFEIERMEPGGPHPVRAEDLRVMVASAEHGLSDSLPATSTGPGRFEARRRFTIEEVGPREVVYEVTLAFRDPENGVRIPEGAVTFPLAAAPAH